MLKPKHNLFRSEKGFSIIEALIGFAIFSIGFIALATIQSNLAYHSDIAKQKTEAIRFAQNEIEALRNFSEITGTTDSWNSLTSTSTPILRDSYSLPNKTISINTVFNIQRSIDSDINKTFRLVSAVISWPDRKGITQSMTLASIVSKSSSIDSAYLNFPLPQNTFLKRPKSRNINIPISATDLGNGSSAFQLSANYAIIFNDASGYIIKKCNTVITSLEQTNDTQKCTNYNAYLLAGYITADNDSSLTGLGINTASITNWDNSNGKLISCIYQPALNQNTQTAIPKTYYYICVIPSLTNQGWSGKVMIGGIPVGSNQTFKVCRFQYPTETGANNNQRNVQPYTNVTESIDNQNYFIDTKSSSNCPIISSLQTIIHQDCRNVSSNLNTITGPMGTCPSGIYNSGP
jgi:type II secretory pathway pseudopilin PulG